jgi:quinol monooxygenase YgiN
MPQIALTGTLACAADDLALVARLLPEHVRLSRAEPGCLSFHVAPSAADPLVFEVRELFDSREAFDAHQARSRTSDWGRATAHIPREYRIEERG